MAKDSLELKDRVCVVTGGSRGIGKAVALALTSRGARVVLGDILDDVGQATAQEFNERAGSRVAVYHHTNVVKYKDNISLFQRAEKEFGRVDVAFLNAGTSAHADIVFGPLDDEADEVSMNVNAISVIKGTKVAIRYLAKYGGGVIVNCASFYGFYTADSSAAYAASKHAVVGWTKSFKTLPQICNIRVNAVCPYFVETDLIRPPFPIPEEHMTPMLKLMRKLPRADMSTVVRAVLMLIEDESINARMFYALPNDVVKEQEMLPRLDADATPEVLKAYQEYDEDLIKFSKAKLEAALKDFQ